MVVEIRKEESSCCVEDKVEGPTWQKAEDVLKECGHEMVKPEELMNNAYFVASTLYPGDPALYSESQPTIDERILSSIEEQKDLFEQGLRKNNLI